MKFIPKADRKPVLESKRSVTLTVLIGPDTSKATTRGQLAHDLKEAAKRHPKSFLKQMFEHFAEHIEDAARHDPDGYGLDSPVDLKIPFGVAYSGEGSCHSCTSGNCCECMYDGHTWCENC
jgi:hypothetical protein